VTAASYAIVLAPRAKRALTESLPSSAAFAAWEFIVGPLAERPHDVGVRLRAPFQGLWRARRGEYRVRYRIDDDAHRIIVMVVDHGRGAYRT
jgi:mRNA-degrading endonuclease RelE of RelBE toxin-antitoxin system